jgi:predicted ferric reductase
MQFSRTHRIARVIGKSIMAVVGVAMPVLLAFFATGHLPGTTFPVIALGATAFTLMGLNLLLATRWPGLDALFGGLDQIYFAHKWMGITALICAFLHQQIKINTPGQQVMESTSALSIEVAEWSFYALVVLVLISFFKRLPKLKYEIPYGVWRWSHRLLGFVFAGIAFHQFFVKAPFDNNTLLATHLNIIALIGIASFVWTQVGPWLRTSGYKVSKITKHPAATIVDLHPRGRGIRPKPGSFAFVSFATKGLRETHPFTVSRTSEDGGIQFSIRGLGDFTRHLRDALSEGDHARVEGGYGRFDYRRGGQAQVWVAAGIGITPFLAWADSLTADNKSQIVLIYCVRNEAEGVGLDRLQAAAERMPGFSFILHKSDTDGRFDAARLAALAPFEIAKASLWFCGPPPLRVALQKGLKEAGKRPRSVHFERFEFR